ncbi:MAG: hypothetical protein WCF18_24235 [Chthoniobacteraceae bacterium]
MGVLSATLLPPLAAQVPDTAAPAAPPASDASAKPGESKFLGKDVPLFDPGTELLTWDGKTWNVNNNRAFQARFEKYLSAPEETSAEARQYQAIINEILNRLAPGSATTANIDAAFKYLPMASRYDIDARLGSALADAVYTVWVSQRQQARLTAANEALRYARHGAYFRVATSDTGNQLEETNSNSKTTKSGNDTKTATDTVKTAGRQGRAAMELAELEAAIKANDARKTLSELQVKVEFQALIVQFFMQRRFQHVLMATRFYRAVFTDGDSKLNLGKDATELFQKSTGVPPTISILDSLANEALRDVREGVKAYEFLLEKNELESAAKRLAEAFTVGEWVPEIRTLPREKKRQALEFVQKSNQLLSSMEVKDYTKAEALLNDLAKIAKDFDPTKPRALIESSRRGAALHLASARNAALRSDEKTLKEEIAAAAELWPLNPTLAEVSQKIFDQGDLQQKAVADFEQLVGQKNFRQIFENSTRFIAALAFYPDKQKQLQDVLQNMQKIEGAILRADEMAKQSNYAGAWESVEKAAADFPDDSKLNQMRANLTTQAADFVRTLRSAQDLEKKEQVGSSLAWYLKAKKLYPQSDYAGEGVERLAKKIIPEG